MLNTDKKQLYQYLYSRTVKSLHCNNNLVLVVSKYLKNMDTLIRNNIHQDDDILEYKNSECPISKQGPR